MSASAARSRSSFGLVTPATRAARVDHSGAWSGPFASGAFASGPFASGLPGAGSFPFSGPGGVEDARDRRLLDRHPRAEGVEARGQSGTDPRLPVSPREPRTPDAELVQPAPLPDRDFERLPADAGLVGGLHVAPLRRAARPLTRGLEGRDHVLEGPLAVEEREVGVREGEEVELGVVLVQDDGPEVLGIGAGEVRGEAQLPVEDRLQAPAGVAVPAERLPVHAEAPALRGLQEGVRGGPVLGLLGVGEVVGHLDAPPLEGDDLPLEEVAHGPPRASAPGGAGVLGDRRPAGGERQRDEEGGEGQRGRRRGAAKRAEHGWDPPEGLEPPGMIPAAGGRGSPRIRGSGAAAASVTSPSCRSCRGRASSPSGEGDRRWS